MQRVVSITADCDKDALVIDVVKSGPACHTGAESCFFNPVYVSDELKQFTWQGLYALIEGRKTDPKEGSYTTYLFDKGLEKILKRSARNPPRSSLQAPSATGRRPSTRSATWLTTSWC